ncbi:hypothetical protein H5410_037610 [Solanum commersonii]|uniref:Uncharacterized protein n=1 Tax=Solanum commersonii TaxID=4109 RepID=A0A9J5Y8G5_SOLCO|nr:hypothetical protein H5410_037610 [Solanum commersonii]
MCTWDLRYNLFITTTFERRASAKLSSWLKKVRDTDERLDWMLPHIFDELHLKKNGGALTLGPEVFKKTHVRKKENESNPDVWVEKRDERTFIATMSAQIAQLTSALAKLEQRRVAEQQSLSETV